MFFPYQNYYSYSSWYVKQPPFVPQQPQLPFMQEDFIGPEATFVQNISPAYPGQSFVQGQNVYPTPMGYGPTFMQGQTVSPTQVPPFVQEQSFVPTQTPSFVQSQSFTPTQTPSFVQGQSFAHTGPTFIQGQSISPQPVPFPSAIRSNERKDIKKEIHPIVIEEKPEKAEVKPIYHMPKTEMKVKNVEMPKPKIEIEKPEKKIEIKKEKEQVMMVPELNIEYKEIKMTPVEIEKEEEMVCYPCFPFFLPSQKCKKPIYPIVEPICECPPVDPCKCPPHYLNW